MADSTITVRFSEEERQIVQRSARAKGMNVSEFLRWSVTRFEAEQERIMLTQIISERVQIAMLQAAQHGEDVEDPDVYTRVELKVITSARVFLNRRLYLLDAALVEMKT